MPGRPVSNNSLGLHRNRRGFTLLELLTVVAILAAVAFVVTSRMGGLQEQTSQQLVQTEIQEIATAIRRFKQDTGYYPRQGPFGLTDKGGAVTHQSLPSSAGNTTDWFYSPANFYQLFVNPVMDSGNPLSRLASWDTETSQGWRGPYLQGFIDGYLEIGTGINNGTEAEYGNPCGDPLNGNVITNVNGIADPFEHAHSNNGLMGWSAAVGGNKRTSWGRPYLFFLAGTGSDGNCTGTAEDRFLPHLVSMGPDGRYGTNDDIILYIE